MVMVLNISLVVLNVVIVNDYKFLVCIHVDNVCTER